MLCCPPAQPTDHPHLLPCPLTSIPLQTGWSSFISNAFFWVLVLGGKFAFDWFALIKPLHGPVLGLLNQNWLGGAGRGNADYVLVIARCLPSFIVMFNDTQVGC